MRTSPIHNSRFTILVFCLLFQSAICNLQSAIAASGSITITWLVYDRSQVLSYRIYWGNGPRNYMWSEEIGRVDSITFTELDAAQVYYFAVAAYGLDGSLGELSNEIVATPQ